MYCIPGHPGVSRISFFQAVKEGKTSLVLALARKGVLDIPMLFVFNALLPPFGLAWATPIADIICCGMAVLCFKRYLGVREGTRRDNRVAGEAQAMV